MDGQEEFKDFAHQIIKVIVEKRDQKVMKECCWIDGTKRADELIDLLIKILDEWPQFQFWIKGRPFGPNSQNPEEQEELLIISLYDHQISQLLKFTNNLDDNNPDKKILIIVVNSLQALKTKK